MKNRIKVSAAAAAVAAAFAAPAAHAIIIGAGASAVNTSVLSVIIGGYCGANAANTTSTPTVTVDYYDNAAAQTSLAKGTTYLVSCANPSTIPGVTFALTLTSNPIQISYDDSGGSWKAFQTTSPAIFSASLLDAAAWAGAGAVGTDLNPVYTINPATCTTSVAKVVTSPANLAGITVQYHANCPIEVANGANQNQVTGIYNANGTLATAPYTVSTLTGVLGTNTDTPTFGMTDVESKLFSDTTVNQPLAWNQWAQTTAPALMMSVFGPLSSGASINFVPATEITITGVTGGAFPKQAYGVVFGVAASGPLWLAMQQDQLNAGVLPTAICGTVAAGNLASPWCVPYISKEQYASLVTQTGGTMLNNANGLFQQAPYSTANSVVEVARRDNGSGTQAGSNAYFSNQGCGVTATEVPDALMLPWLSQVENPGGSGTATNSYVYDLSTNDVLARLVGTQPNDGMTTVAAPASQYVIGVVTAEKYSATTMNNTGTFGSSTAPWGFLRLDGFLPTIQNVSAGLYQYTTTEMLHCNSAATGDAAQLCKDLMVSGSSLANYSQSIGDFATLPIPVGDYPIASAPTANGNYLTNAKSCNGARHH